MADREKERTNGRGKVDITHKQGRKRGHNGEKADNHSKTAKKIGKQLPATSQFFYFHRGLQKEPTFSNLPIPAMKK